MELSRSDFKKLRSKLPPNWKETLADEFQLTQGTVANILSGIGKNEPVILAALTMAENHKKQITNRLAAL